MKRAIQVTALLAITLGGPLVHGQGMDYPPLYKSLRLPELPRATLTSNGRETTSLREGLTIRLSAPMPANEIRGFYANALAKSGWTVAPARQTLPGTPIANLQATKDRMTFSAAMTAQGGATQVNLTVTEQ